MAFHFKRLLKSLDWNATRYLGAEMFGYWQQALVREEYLRQEREKRREVRQQKKEQKKLLQLQRELEAANRRDKSSGSITTRTDSAVNEKDLLTTKQSASTTSISSHFHTIPLGGLSPKGASSSTKKGSRHGSRIGFLHRFAGLKRTMSTDKLTEPSQPLETKDAALSGIVKSPSMPAIWGSFGNNQGEDLIIDIHSDANVNGGDDNNSDLESEDDGIII